jgi:hypothetical protein
VRFVEQVVSQPVDKDGLAAQLRSAARHVHEEPRRAHAPRRGHRARRGNILAAKKPGTGISPALGFPEVVGRPLNRALNADELLNESDLR